ncbi:MAG: asparaginase [Rubrivivax sp.]
MQSATNPSSNVQRTTVILGTGGTIAGTAEHAHDNVGYRAAQLGVDQLLAGLPWVGALHTEQVAQVDSKDMEHTLWRTLAERVALHLARPEVDAVVITHGTDTLEETAYFLHRVLAPAKPVVLTAAMRPASALLSDGPQNLLDALALAATPGARGVLVVMAQQVYGATGLRKAHSYKLDALSAGDAGPLGRIEEGHMRRFRDWPEAVPLGLAAVLTPVANWPRVEIVFSHAGADGSVVDALMQQPPQGIVVAGSGNGSVHARLEAALRRAMAKGVAVRRCTRCAAGGVIGGDADDLPAAGDLTPVQARIALMLELMAEQR